MTTRSAQPDSDPGGQETVVATTGWDETITAWLGWLRAGGRPATTIYLRDYQIRRVALAFPGGPWVLSVDDLAGWLGSHDWAPETRRSYRAALRTFYGWGHVTGRMPVNPAGLLPTVRPPAGRPRPAPEVTYRTALVGATPREGLMLRLGANAGLRRGEICRVRGDDVEADLSGWSLRVVGKGGRVRLVPLLDDLAGELLTYSGWVFPGQVDGHLSPAYVGKLMSRLLGPGWTAHGLRHRFAARAYEPERDIRAVQELLGHASVVTTQRYTPVPAGALRAAVQAAA